MGITLLTITLVACTRLGLAPVSGETSDQGRWADSNHALTDGGWADRDLLADVAGSDQPVDSGIDMAFDRGIDMAFDRGGRQDTSPDAPSQDTSPDAPSQDTSPDAPSQDTSPDAPSQDTSPDTPLPDSAIDQGLQPLVLGTPSDPSTWAWIYIPAGVFQMGSAAGEIGRNANWETQHQVTLTHGFYILAHEVTLAQYRAILGKDPPNPADWASCTQDDCAALNISQIDAIDFANKLSDRAGLGRCSPSAPYTCKGYRLPTEAEWEYAARAGTQTATWLGNHKASEITCNSSLIGPIAWYCGNAGGKLQRVGRKQPNPWGLYDMLGNAPERTLDRYGEATVVDYHGGAKAVVDPFVWVSSGPSNPVRGGSYASNSSAIRAAYRMDSYPNRIHHHERFRVVRTAGVD
jgi:sulfatase modifying factor 1